MKWRNQLIKTFKIVFFQFTNLTSSVDYRWVEGPSMNEGRINHECGRIRRSNKSDDYSIIVVGGGADNDRSVEILDIENGTWRSGPQFPSKLST